MEQSQQSEQEGRCSKAVLPDALQYSDREEGRERQLLELLLQVSLMLTLQQAHHEGVGAHQEVVEVRVMQLLCKVEISVEKK